MRFTALPVHSFEDATLDLEQLQALLTLPAWTAPALINSWANNGGGFETAGYLKDALGFVHVKGVIVSGTNNTAAFVLPAGYRPGATTFHPATNSALTSAVVKVDTSGNVIPFSAAATTSFVGLSSITFRAEN